MPGAESLRVSRYASFIHSRSMTWCSEDSATPRFVLASSAIRCQAPIHDLTSRRPYANRKRLRRVAVAMSPDFGEGVADWPQTLRPDLGYGCKSSLPPVLSRWRATFHRHGGREPMTNCRNRVVRIDLVPLHSDYDSFGVSGYARPILARALSVVNIHLMRAPTAFGWRSQAAISRRSHVGSSILRFKHCPRRTPISISTMLSQLA